MLTQAEEGNVEKNLEAAGNRTQVAGLSHQCSNYWATTTHDHQSPPHSVLLSGTALQLSHTQQPSVCAVRTPSGVDRKQFSLWRRSTPMVFNLKEISS